MSWCSARARASVSLLLAAGSLALPAHAEVLFRGDMETGDLKQWSFLLKEEGLSVVTDQVAEGTKAAKVTISKNEVWTNGLNRVEVQHSPKAANVAVGADIYYGFSFYLPEALTTDDHQILYWETNSNGSYLQIMQVAVQGQKVRFATQKPEWKVHWEADNKATPGKWHRIVQHVKWSDDPAVGQVDLWFDGEQVVTAGKAQTHLGGSAFVQHGILRQPTIDKVEVLYFDDARSGTTLEDVLTPATVPGGGGAGGAGGQGSGGGSQGGGIQGGGSQGGGSNQGGTSGNGGGNDSTSGTAGASVGGTAGAGGAASSAGTGAGGGAAGASSTTAGAASSTPPVGEGSGCAFSPQRSQGVAALAALLAVCAWRRRRAS